VAKPIDIVQGFQQAVAKGDLDKARAFLHDNLSFRGPFDTFERPEPYLEALKRLALIIERIEPRKIFVDDDDVCVLYDMVTRSAAGTAFIVEWFQVRGERIAAIRAVFDPRPFVPLFAGR
jgi:ketosteroid isomerase-like protein